MRKLLLTLLGGLFAAPLAAHWDASRPDSHAPIGVMGEHTHKAGEWMVSYRFMQMRMKGWQDGTDDLTNGEVAAPPYSYFIVPTKHWMEMHMLGAMYAPSDDLTLMAMLPWTSNSMSHVTGAPGAFSTESQDLGDLRVSGMFVVERGEQVQSHLTLGIGVPTGSIDERDDTPMGANSQLPYPMQTGSGTWDVAVAGTRLHQDGDVSWGYQASGLIRLGENDNGYTLGDRFEATFWGAIAANDTSSGSIRFGYSNWGDIDGTDSKLGVPPGMAPTADPDLRAGQRIDLGLGYNHYFREGAFAGHRLALEFIVPVWQDLDGPQLETDWMIVAGWQKAFK